MNQELLLKLTELVLSIVIIYAVEELICFFIIKKQDRAEDYKKQKSAHKGIYLHSQYLYKDKKYLMGIKVVLIVFVVLIGAFSNNSTKYYDAKNNSCKKQIDILFYDKNGYTYSIDKESEYFVYDNKLTDKSVVDSQGFVADINEDDLYVSSMSGIDYLLTGDIYFSNTHVYWDKDNRLHYFNAQKDYIIDEYNFTVDVKTGVVTAQRK